MRYRKCKKCGLSMLYNSLQSEVTCVCGYVMETNSQKKQPEEHPSSRETRIPTQRIEVSDHSSSRTTPRGFPLRPPQGNDIMGLQNIGMSCFMNSVLNSLYFVPQFYFYFDRAKADTKLAYLIQKFISLYGKEAIPTELLCCIRDYFPKFRSGQMESAFEFLKSLLQGLYEETQGKSLSKPVHDVYGLKSLHDTFTILVEEKKKCCKCKTSSSSPTEMSLLRLNIAQPRAIRVTRDTLPCHVSLEASLDAYLCEQTDSPETSCKCRECQQDQIHTSKKSIKHVGSVVIIYLQRYNTVNSRTPVTVSHVLEMSKYKEGAGTYSLCSAIQHEGNVLGGHYKCFALASSGWMCISDSHAQLLPKYPVNEINACTLFIYRLD